ncbi:MAG: hypothetical protein GX030_08500 [Firmicutes bacterium]|nr:hypothetical protein [Bacillota bacterium]
MAKRLVLVLLICHLLAGGVKAATNLPEVPDLLLGKGQGELQGMLGTPDYIKVYDHGPAQQYAYFTTDEWALIAPGLLADQGEDVFIVNAGGRQLQYHVTYTPAYPGGNRFAPSWLVGSYIIYGDGNTTLGSIGGILPASLDLKEVKGGWIQHFDPPYSPVLLLQWPADGLFPDEAFRRFRERGPVEVIVEIGLADYRAGQSLDPEGRIHYVVVRTGTLPQGLTEVSIEDLFD